MAARILHPTYPPFVLLCIRPLFISPILCPPLNLPHTPNSHREFSTTCIKFWFLLAKITMKFGKSLNNQTVETLPDWRDKFLSYKDLKKQLKQIGAVAGTGERRSKRQRVGDGDDPRGGRVCHPPRRRARQVQRLLPREGGGLRFIRMKDWSRSSRSTRTGALIRLPFIQNVMQEPFYATDVLYKLVKECEEMLDQLLPRNQRSVPSEDDGKEDSDSDDKPAKPSASLANGNGTGDMWRKSRTWRACT
ncbi:unnamed protein product [Miscanthus lutarioriparius]|uniref:SPX domain-containing protein n=1 Tax=Miscanthus lutarioriparius TaxID=422564 RepID=A0A811Q4E5_9POAL|nr:unnamed protein product [Miscanthus lutarioriparius]